MKSQELFRVLLGDAEIVLLHLLYFLEQEGASTWRKLYVKVSAFMKGKLFFELKRLVACSLFLHLESVLHPKGIFP